jgi:hypothetical protein
MKTRKNRKWYRLNGMLRAGKFQGVIDIPVVIYYLDPQGEVHTVASCPSVILCRGSEPGVDKATAALTGKYPLHRLYVWAGVAPENIEICRQQLSDQLNNTKNFVLKELE